MRGIPRHRVADQALRGGSLSSRARFRLPGPAAMNAGARGAVWSRAGGRGSGPTGFPTSSASLRCQTARGAHCAPRRKWIRPPRALQATPRHARNPTAKLPSALLPRVRVRGPASRLGTATEPRQGAQVPASDGRGLPDGFPPLLAQLHECPSGQHGGRLQPVRSASRSLPPVVGRSGRAPSSARAPADARGCARRSPHIPSPARSHWSGSHAGSVPSGRNPPRAAAGRHIGRPGGGADRREPRGFRGRAGRSRQQHTGTGADDGSGGLVSGRSPAGPASGLRRGWVTAARCLSGRRQSL